MTMSKQESTQEFLSMKRLLHNLLNADKDKALGYVWEDIVDLSYHVLMMEDDYNTALSSAKEAKGVIGDKRSSIQRSCPE